MLAGYSGRPVLIVDDDPVVLKGLSHLIGRLGLQVDTASNALKALECIDTGPDYLACLVDWRMPEIDGGETIRRLRAAYIARGKQPPPMLLMAAGSHEPSIQAVRKEIDGFRGQASQHLSAPYRAGPQPRDMPKARPGHGRAQGRTPAVVALPWVGYPDCRGRRG